MQALINLLVRLHRHECTAHAATGQMSPRERAALQKRLTLARHAIPRYVLSQYDTLKRREPVLGECSAALAMAAFVAAYRKAPTRRRRALATFACPRAATQKRK
jgi:hypothetical protein